MLLCMADRLSGTVVQQVLPRIWEAWMAALRESISRNTALA